jgi:sRNA-binding protein
MDDTTGETKRRGRMPPEEWQARRRQGEVLIVALASLFPNCFTVEKWKPHRPLKVGVSRDLAELGVVTDAEAHLALSVYTAQRDRDRCRRPGAHGPRRRRAVRPVTPRPLVPPGPATGAIKPERKVNRWRLDPNQ